MNHKENMQGKVDGCSGILRKEKFRKVHNGINEIRFSDLKQLKYNFVQ